MSDEAAPKKKGKGKGLIIKVGAAVLIAGAGAAGGVFAAGGFHKEEGPKEDYNKPQLVLKGENAEEIGNKFAALAHEGAAEGESGHGKMKAIDLPSPKDTSKYQATYFQIGSPFTSNLTDTDAFAQISIAVSTYYDNRVILAVQTHELAIRSALLMLLAQQQEAVLSTPEGKEKLQAQVTKVINDVLKQKTGYSGVDNVYFTNFVIQ